ncbi:MAG: YaaA family protein [Campylobacterales bacterium]
MIKFLFSPSESKVEGGEGVFDASRLLFGEHPTRRRIITTYENFVHTASKDEISKLFGLKEVGSFDLSKSIYDKEVLKAVERYSGVAYKHLNYPGLNKNEQHYIDSSVIIFSNLFGAIRASDRIPFYRLRQGEKVDGVAFEKIYKDELSSQLDEYLDGFDIVDLRASFYQKFYDIKSLYLSMKFVKNNKVVSHYAKAYRGAILRECAIKNVKNLSDLMSMPLDGLKIKEILQRQKQTEIVYEII